MATTKNDSVIRTVYAAPARYTDPGAAQMRGNPFVEALHPIAEDSEAFCTMANFPLKSADIKAMGIAARLAESMQLHDFCNPLERHIILFNTLQVMIRQGYVNRNPKDSEWKKQLVTPLDTNAKTMGLNKAKHRKQTSALATTLIGPSGTGKSSAVRAALRGLDQLIVHPDGTLQITYLTFICPTTGLKSVMWKILEEFDLLLDEHFYEESVRRRMTTPQLVSFVATKCRLYAVGLLVIDEANNIKEASEDYEVQAILGFFIDLIEVINIPVLFVGNDSCRKLLQGQLRMARRVSGVGSIEWELFKLDDEWFNFAIGLLSFQWTDEQATYEEIGVTLFEECCGIADVAIKKFMISQYEANRHALPKVTSELIAAVSKKYFILVEPMLAAVRDGQISALERYSDLLPYFHKTMTELEIQVRAHGERQNGAGNMQRMRSAIEESNKTKESLVQQIFRALQALNRDEGWSLAAAEAVVLGNPNLRDAAKGVALALKYNKPMHLPNSPPKKNGKNSAMVPSAVDLLETDDLRRIVMEAGRSGASAYQALVQASVIWTDVAWDMLCAE